MDVPKIVTIEVLGSGDSTSYVVKTRDGKTSIQSFAKVEEAQRFADGFNRGVHYAKAISKQEG